VTGLSDTKTTAPTTAGAPAKRQRDLRLDFFRGLAMFIILLAHTPGNTWTLWIPARFGFSDATEIFVFCSGMASAIAFGTVFVNRSWWLGSARIVYRIWQVYWAHIGMVLATVAMLFTIDFHQLGLPDKVYIESPYMVPLFERTGEALVGLLTLTYVPNYFDILPMYLVILAMVPVVMLAFRLAGKEAVFALVLAVWLAAQFQFLKLPSRPWSPEIGWFFNPFGWQLVFFTGFAFGMKWLPAPPVTRALVWLAVAAVLITLPFAWFKIHGGLYLPGDWAVTGWIGWFRDLIEPLRWKTDVGAWRYLHFLAVAYLAWAAVGAGGFRLRDGWTAPGPAGRRLFWTSVAVAFVTIPYAYVDELPAVAPGLAEALTWLYGEGARSALGFDLFIESDRIGLAQIGHLVAVVIVVWTLIGAARREWLARDAFLALVPVIRKVGTQSLAVFMVSIILARFNGWWMDMIGRDVWTRLLVNGTGFAVLIATAYVVGWFRKQPWRTPPAQQVARAPSGAAATPAE
jgi:hypothetical protein